MTQIFKGIEISTRTDYSLDFSCTIVFGCLCIYFYIKVLKASSRTKKLVDQFPGPKTLPIFGNVLHFLVPNHELLEVVKSIFGRYGKTFRLWLGNQPNLMVADPLVVEKILSSDNLNKGKQYEFLQPWIGLGLLTSTEQKWRNRRRLIAPAFHFKVLEGFMEVFNEQSLILVDILSSKCADINEDINLSLYLALCALDIICETAMGKRINAQMEKDSEYVKSVDSITELVIQRSFQPWLHPSLIWKFSRKGRLYSKYLKVLHTFTEKVIKERKKGRNLIESQKDLLVTTPNQKEDHSRKKDKNRKAFLDLLLDSSEIDNTLTDLDIREEVDTFMVAGYDTSATNLGWVLYMLGKHPKIQERVQTELDEIFGESITHNLTMTDVAKMKYLECCIKETLRIYPSVPTFIRAIQQDIDLGNGLIIPAGVNCLISTYFLHRDPETFPDPEAFDPDRFLLENVLPRNPYSYVPFSAGPRNCIGQKYALLEIKVVLAHLLRTFRFEAMDEQKDLKIVADIGLRSKDGLRFRVFKRTPKTYQIIGPG